ncbi:hypothetical protein EJB05_06516, partial [Eragrostis curvula]
MSPEQLDVSEKFTTANVLAVPLKAVPIVELDPHALPWRQRRTGLKLISATSGAAAGRTTLGAAVGREAGSKVVR